MAVTGLIGFLFVGSAVAAPGDVTVAPVADINPGPTGSDIDELTDVNGTLYFTADDGTNGIELWTSDGTAATLVEDAVPGGGINPGSADSAPADLTVLNGDLYFGADDGDGEELWKADGATATLIEDVVPGGGINPGSGSAIGTIVKSNSTLFFHGDDGTNGGELWSSDGATATMIEDAVPGGGINPGSSDSNPQGLTDVNGTLFFWADDGTNGIELWKSDGATATLLEDAVPGGGINPGSAGSFPDWLTDVNGTLFFSADDGTNGRELWKSNGTTATMIEDALPGGGINPGAADSSPSGLTNVNGTSSSRRTMAVTEPSFGRATAPRRR